MLDSPTFLWTWRFQPGGPSVVKWHHVLVTSFFQLEETPLEEGTPLDMPFKPTQTRWLSSTVPFPPPPPFSHLRALRGHDHLQGQNKMGKTMKFGLYIYHISSVLCNPCYIYIYTYIVWYLYIYRSIYITSPEKWLAHVIACLEAYQGTRLHWSTTWAQFPGLVLLMVQVSGEKTNWDVFVFKNHVGISLNGGTPKTPQDDHV